MLPLASFNQLGTSTNTQCSHAMRRVAHLIPCKQHGNQLRTYLWGQFALFDKLLTTPRDRHLAEDVADDRGSSATTTAPIKKDDVFSIGVRNVYIRNEVDKRIVLSSPGAVIGSVITSNEVLSKDLRKIFLTGCGQPASASASTPIQYVPSSPSEGTQMTLGPQAQLGTSFTDSSIEQIQAAFSSPESVPGEGVNRPLFATHIKEVIMACLSDAPTAFRIARCDALTSGIPLAGMQLELEAALRLLREGMPPRHGVSHQPLHTVVFSSYHRPLQDFIEVLVAALEAPVADRQQSIIWCPSTIAPMSSLFIADALRKAIVTFSGVGGCSVPPVQISILYGGLPTTKLVLEEAKRCHSTCSGGGISIIGLPDWPLEPLVKEEFISLRRSKADSTSHQSVRGYSLEQNDQIGIRDFIGLDAVVLRHGTEVNERKVTQETDAKRMQKIADAICRGCFGHHNGVDPLSLRRAYIPRSWLFAPAAQPPQLTDKEKGLSNPPTNLDRGLHKLFLPAILACLKDHYKVGHALDASSGIGPLPSGAAIQIAMDTLSLKAPPPPHRQPGSQLRLISGGFKPTMPAKYGHFMVPSVACVMEPFLLTPSGGIHPPPPCDASALHPAGFAAKRGPILLLYPYTDSLLNDRNNEVVPEVIKAHHDALRQESQ